MILFTVDGKLQWTDHDRDRLAMDLDLAVDVYFWSTHDLEGGDAALGQ